MFGRLARLSAGVHSIAQIPTVKQPWYVYVASGTPGCLHDTVCKESQPVVGECEGPGRSGEHGCMHKR
jgi:hypothetical protein